MANSLISIQIIPNVPDEDNKYEYVDAAINVMEEAGVTYNVHPLETTMEGDMSELMAAIQQMNEKLVNMGADNIISQIKILYQPSGITAKTLTEKYNS